jgi:hypothetical protein
VWSADNIAASSTATAEPSRSCAFHNYPAPGEDPDWQTQQRRSSSEGRKKQPSDDDGSACRGRSPSRYPESQTGLRSRRAGNRAYGAPGRDSSSQAGDAFGDEAIAQQTYMETHRVQLRGDGLRVDAMTPSQRPYALLTWCGIARRTVSVVVALQCKTCPIVPTENCWHTTVQVEINYFDPASQKKCY